MKCEKHNEEKIKHGNKLRCKTCNKEHQKKWYSKNNKTQYERVTNGKEKYKKQNREFIIEYLKNNPCCICGENDIVVLDFDHLQDKKYDVSKLIYLTSSLETIKKEIEKCQILCANCHRRKTAKERNYYKTNN